MATKYHDVGDLIADKLKPTEIVSKCDLLGNNVAKCKLCTSGVS